ncbi:MAG: WG repeat-containing protein [Cyanobacteria bacterium SZAS-4]|nr:WG repeat-containing protein [Cyanobacteria bacterium SZAS-4]
MSEFLEKLEQPELVVASSSIVVSAEPHSSSEVANPAVVSNNSGTISSTRSESQKNAVPIPNSSSLTAPRSIDAGKKSNSSSRMPSGTTKGIVRHRLITGCCLTLSLAVLSLSAFDLRGLIEKDGSLDPSLKFTAGETKSELPLHLRYQDPSWPSSEGLRKITDYSSDAVGFVDEKGTVVLPAVYSMAGDFHDGLAAVKFRKESIHGTVAKNEFEKWAYINRQGETVLAPAYHDAGQFENGVAPVAIDGHGVLINKKGVTIATSSTSGAPRQFGDLYEMSGKDYKCGLMDATGKFVVPPIYDRIEAISDTKDVVRGRNYTNKSVPYTTSNEYFKVFQNGKCGLISNTGELLIPIQHKDIASYNKGHAVVKRDFRWGLVDAHNNYIIEANYDFISRYDDIIATKTHTGKWNVFDSNGKLLNTKIDGAMADMTSPWLWDGMAAFVIDDKCGFLNGKGEVAIKPDYDLVQHFSNGFGLVMQNGLWRFIDTNGVLASPITFAAAAPFASGKATVTKAGPLYDFINMSQIESKKYDYERNRSDAKAGQGHY